MDMHMAYTWMIMTGGKPQHRRYQVENSLHLGRRLRTSLSQAINGFVEMWVAMGRAITTPLKSFTYCQSHPTECPG